MKKNILFMTIVLVLIFSVGCTNNVKDKPVTLDLSTGAKEGIYSGELNSDSPNGKGKFDYKDKNNNNVVFDGEFKDGHFGKHGSLFIAAENRKYEGEFNNDLPNGQGKTYSNGKLIYEGSWKNGIPNGNGKLYNANGSIAYEGNFESGFPMASTFNLNQNVSFADWTYKVTKVETQTTVGNSPASGIYVVVHIDATNKSTTQRQIGAQNFFVLFDDKGRKYNLHDKAMLDDRMLTNDHNSSWYLSQIGPSLSASDIKLIFDVPKDAKNLKLIPSNGFGKANPVLLIESLS